MASLGLRAMGVEGARTKGRAGGRDSNVVSLQINTADIMQ